MGLSECGIHSMRRMLEILVFTSLLFLAGCGSSSKPFNGVHTMSTAFDPTAARYIDNLGSGTISGRAYQADLFTGAGAKLQLVPVTAYSTEYMGYLFGSSKAYYTPTHVDKVHPQFRRYQRRTKADENGRYTFSGVPAGEYFVYAQLVENRTGVALYERVTIADGQQLQIDLTGS